MDRPSYVANFDRPPHTGIKEVNGHWHLHERTCKHDPETGKSRTLRGACPGLIDEDGFHPKKTRISPDTGTPFVEIGATRRLCENTLETRGRLGTCFPDLWPRICAAALLEAVAPCPLHQLQARCRKSIVSAPLPGLPMSKGSPGRLLKTLGTRQDAMTACMRQDVRSSTDHLLIDGRRILPDARNMLTARPGHNKNRSFDPQISLLHMFTQSDAGAGWPVFFEQFPGNMPDVSAIPPMLASAGVPSEKVIVAGDKGRASDDIAGLIADAGLFCCMPLKRNTCLVDSIPASGHYDDAFTCHGRAIEWKACPQDGFNVFLYLDSGLAAEETAIAVQEKRVIETTIGNSPPGSPGGRKARERLQALETRRARILGVVDTSRPLNAGAALQEKPARGTIALRTNKAALSAPGACSVCRQRPAIGAFFKTHGVTLACEASCMRDEHTMDSWLFISHVVAQMAMTALNMLHDLDLTTRISWDDMRRGLAHMDGWCQDGRWHVAPVIGDSLRLCDRPGIDPLDMDSLNDTI